ncbi:hypothetical protein [Actinomadura rugatobispora]|uniref:Uncharacterized protein n=1 Tax=Actinomadura rugatobispora TaxID=1994 RepID=A0ABW1A158_9ACTN|nr:hypothetical protein GCM10010200_017080 [Actinomadura rugatobispora]
MAETGEEKRASGPVSWTVVLVRDGIAIWCAAQILRDVRLEGPAGRQAAAVLVVLLLSRLLGWLALQGVRQLQDRRLWRQRWIRSHPGTTVSAFFVGSLSLAVVLEPFAWWAADAVCRALDLPLHMSGLWVFVAAPLVKSVIGFLLRSAADLRKPGELGKPIRFAACLGVLWLLVAVLDGVRLAAGQWWRTLLTTVVLAALFNVVNLRISMSSTFPWAHTRRRLRRGMLILAVYSLVANALVLWPVSWFSTALRPSLEVAGTGTFLLGGLIATVVMWAANLPFFLAGLRARGLSMSGGGTATGYPIRLHVSRFGYIWESPPPSPS